MSIIALPGKRFWRWLLIVLEVMGYATLCVLLIGFIYLSYWLPFPKTGFKNDEAAKACGWHRLQEECRRSHLPVQDYHLSYFKHAHEKPVMWIYRDDVYHLRYSHISQLPCMDITLSSEATFGRWVMFIAHSPLSLLMAWADNYAYMSKADQQNPEKLPCYRYALQHGWIKNGRFVGAGE